jgi:hypothetical protein
MTRVIMPACEFCGTREEEVWQCNSCYRFTCQSCVIFNASPDGDCRHEPNLFEGDNWDVATPVPEPC